MREIREEVRKKTPKKYGQTQIFMIFETLRKVAMKLSKILF